MKTRGIIANGLALALVATAVMAFLSYQRDHAAAQPLPEARVTQYRVDYAVRKAKAQRRFLMIEFGAAWCEDCRVLAQDLQSEVARGYFQSHFNFLNIDIGHSDRNFGAADTLGVDLSHGIPAVVMFAPDGSRIGATDHGELEPSRNYRPEQILQFLKAVVDHRALTNPAVDQ